MTAHARVFEVRTPKGLMHVVSLLPSERVFKKGLPNQAIVGVLTEGAPRIEARNFSPNPAFVAFLHEVLARYGPSGPGLVEEARRLGDGHVFIIDGRAPDPMGTVDPEDIIGALKVQAGKVVPQSYQANPNHLLVSLRGLFVLDAWLQDRLLEELLKLN